jgi:hypothetical protein
MSAARYAAGLPTTGPRWWRTGDRTLDRMQQEQRRAAWATHRYGSETLSDAMQRVLDDERIATRRRSRITQQTRAAEHGCPRCAHGSYPELSENDAGTSDAASNMSCIWG